MERTFRAQFLVGTEIVFLRTAGACPEFQPVDILVAFIGSKVQELETGHSSPSTIDIRTTWSSPKPLHDSMFK
jgi:hypothetical protein